MEWELDGEKCSDKLILIGIFIYSVLLRARQTIFIKIISKHNVLKFLLTQSKICKILPSGRSNPLMNLSNRLPAKETSHFPVNESHHH